MLELQATCGGPPPREDVLSARGAPLKRAASWDGWDDLAAGAVHARGAVPPLRWARAFTRWCASVAGHGVHESADGEMEASSGPLAVGPGEHWRFEVLLGHASPGAMRLQLERDGSHLLLCVECANQASTEVMHRLRAALRRRLQRTCGLEVHIEVLPCVGAAGEHV